jgi:hypothetical protein
MEMLHERMKPAAWVSWLQRSGPLLRVPRSRLVVAQTTALAAMAFCYFLAPQFAWAYAIVAVCGFGALALPALAGGPHGIVGDRLLGASPGGHHLPGGAGYAIRLTATLLVAFGLPAAVAAVLPPPISERSADPWVALVCLLVMGGVVVSASRLAGPRGVGVVRLLVVASAFMVLLAALTFAAFPFLPSLPVFRPA